MLKEKELKENCMINMGSRQCRYLSKIEGEDRYVCLKHTGHKIIIDSVLKDAKKNKKNPSGDNCCGVSEVLPV
jgi:hypothetical protein